VSVCWTSTFGRLTRDSVAALMKRSFAKPEHTCSNPLKTTSSGARTRSPAATLPNRCSNVARQGCTFESRLDSIQSDIAWLIGTINDRGWSFTRDAKPAGVKWVPAKIFLFYKKWRREWDSSVDRGRCGCLTRHAVQIEPGLRPQSPKNGSFSNVRRRLSAISLQECPKSEPGDWWPIRKSPPLAAFPRVSGTVSPSAGLPGWSERIRTRAFPIEPGLWVGFLEFGNMRGADRPPCSFGQ
jgi:hypothetical protein